MNDNVAKLVTTKPDAELAEEFKQKVIEAYKPLIDICNEYEKHGLMVQASIGKNAIGQFQLIQLQIIKTF